MKRQVGLFVAVVASGLVIGGSAFAGQLNALGQWVPTSTEEGWREWGESRTTKQAVKQTPGTQPTSAGYVQSRPDDRYRIDALGREVPIQTNLP